VKLIIQKANAIEANQLKERVPVPDSRDEIFNLAVTINSLLSRLEKAFQSQERFIADASHQLKTPLAILRGELDLLLKKERSSEEVDAFLRSLSQEIDHLSKMVEDLLLLARTDAGVETFLFEKVRLDEVLIGEVARLEKLARTKSVKLKLNVDPNIKDFEVKGDVDLLKCLFHNVIENAIKYSPESSPIEVDLKQSLGDNDKLIVEVRDQGPGIAPEELDKIFERFHRSANARNLGLGAGLGLAVAKKIADLHGAEIAAKSLKSQGSQFTVQIKNF
jgi:signal transduction histidine kinase